MLTMDMGMKSFSTYYRALSASLAMMTAESSLVANDPPSLR